MGNSYKPVCSIMVAVGLALGLSTAQAAIVNFTLTGTADTLTEVPNIFGVPVGGNIYATGTFDDSSSLLSGGTGYIYFGSGYTDNSITISVGTTYKFYALDDLTYDLGYPRLSFAGGNFAGLDFSSNTNGDTEFDSQGTFFWGYDNTIGFSTVLTGQWTDFQTTAVPVPAAVWLLGSGLLGLVGIARRKAAT